MNWIKVSSLVVLCAGASMAAMTDLPRTEFSINPGIAMPSGDSSDYLENSFSMDGQLLYRVHELVQIGPEVGYVFGSKVEGRVPGRIAGDVDGDGKEDPVNFTSDAKIRVMHLAPEIKVGPMLTAGGIKIHPFVIGGGGYYWTHFTGGTATVTGHTSGGTDVSGVTSTAESENDSNGGWNVGGGISLMLPQDFAIGFEIRYHRILYKEGDNTTFVTPALRLTLLFP